MKRFDEKIDVYISSSNNDRTAHISPAKGSYHRYILHKAHLARTTSFSLLSVDRRLKGRQRAVYRLLVLIPLFILPYSHIYIHIPSIVSRDFIIAAAIWQQGIFLFLLLLYQHKCLFRGHKVLFSGFCARELLSRRRFVIYNRRFAAASVFFNRRGSIEMVIDCFLRPDDLCRSL